ncbi:hypothetical protein [Chryseobacterium lathyri]|uniref:Uncharacterized protein n=1 Tax=Chryseobacterium lathyri TaxID=395933 RepID=A0ABT9SK05_9FLAO|nr:hypothetical protein [Chryseobacterium lathyri]MDP9959171.1 hypothetical protein [Chryseobacterium lathyri]
MKKNAIILFSLLNSVFAFSQVGINTTDPKATFDITAKEATGTSRNVDGLLIPRVDRQRAQSMVGTPVSTLIYVNDISTGLQMGTAINIDNIGYYYFDGSFWVKLNTPSLVNPMVNIYNTNGTLESDRTVNQGDKTIAFTGTRVNSFSVDGNTFSVDAANNSVGIGTNTPVAKLDIVGNRMGIKAASGSGSWDNLWFNIDSYSPSINASGAERGILFNVGANATGTYGDGQTLTTVAAMLPNGNMGIGTAAPNANAVLELNATSKGFLPPRLTTAQRNAIPAATKPAGLMIYNTTTNCMDFWNSSAWVSTCAVTAPPAGTITAVTCASATNNGTLTTGINNSVTSSIPYTGGNGGSHGGQIVTSTGVTGLTATLAAGSFVTGNGALTYTITGTPSAVGNANFAINIGGRTCTLTRAVTAPVGSVATLNCAGAINNGTLTRGIAASGVTSVIPYTGGNTGTQGGQVVASTGVTGLTATLTAGTFANGNGTLTYTVTGTPATSGTASFAINIGGRTCTLTRNVVVGPPLPGNVSETCTGWTIGGLYQNNTSVSGTVNGLPVTATVSNLFNAGGNPGGPTYALMVGPTETSSRLKFKFNRAISNFKVSQSATNRGEVYQYILRRNGVIVGSPTILGSNTTYFTITSTSTGGTINANNAPTNGGYSIIYNIGGVWFDEIDIIGSQPAGAAGSLMIFCVGDAQ